MVPCSRRIRICAVRFLPALCAQAPPHSPIALEPKLQLISLVSFLWHFVPQATPSADSAMFYYQVGHTL